MLDDNRRRSNADYDALRKGRRQAEERGRGNQEKLLHKWVFLSQVEFREGDAHAASLPLRG